MRFSQDRLVRAAAAVAESAWLFAVLSVASAAVGLAGSALDWPAALAIVGLSLVLGRLARRATASLEVVALGRTAVWAVAAYIAVASQAGPGPAGVDLAWIAKVFTGSGPEDLALSAGTGVLGTVVLWWRGVRIAATADPVGSLLFGFRVGLVALAFSAIVDILHPADLGVLPMSFVFFASGLGGLTVGHLMPESEESAESGTWLRVTVAIVSGVLLVGLAFGLLHRGVQAAVTGPAVGVLKGLFWAVAAPFFVILAAFTDLVISFFGRPFDPVAAGVPGYREGETSTVGTLIQATEQAVGDPAEEEAELELFVFLTELLAGLFVLVLVVIVLVVLAIVFRRWSRSRTSAGSAGESESIGEGANPLADIADLLLKLIPDWRIGRRRPAFRLPDGPSGVVQVLRIYYELLSLAEDRGHPRRPGETTGEFQRRLERILPPDLVRMATAAFNRACYGFHAATQEQIARMRSSLATAKASAGTPVERGRRLGIPWP